MIVFLHPIFTIVAIILIAYSFLEVNNNRSYKSVWWVVVFMIILLGLRNWVGADYNEYARMFLYYGKNSSYSLILNKENLEVEWLYILLGKIVYDMQLPFFIFTLIIAIIAISSKYASFERITVYPALAMLMYMIPTYFISDGGQMRQGVAIGLIIFSFLYIMKRNLLMFLFIMYIAVGFHKSAYLFIPAYWLVLFPLNSKKMLLLISVCVILSPLKLYQYIALLDSIAPAEVYEGFESYQSLEEGERRIKFYDLLNIFYTYFLVTYDKEACERIPYYEYMRNIGVAGICMYFIFRGSPIFSTRLIINYLIFMVVVLPSIVAAIQKQSLKKGLHFVLIAFVVFYYFLFAYMQAIKIGYTWDGYRNYLW